MHAITILGAAIAAFATLGIGLPGSSCPPKAINNGGGNECNATITDYRCNYHNCATCCVAEDCGVSDACKAAIPDGSWTTCCPFTNETLANGTVRYKSVRFPSMNPVMIGA